MANKMMPKWRKCFLSFYYNLFFWRGVLSFFPSPTFLNEPFLNPMNLPMGMTLFIHHFIATKVVTPTPPSFHCKLSPSMFFYEICIFKISEVVSFFSMNVLYLHLIRYLSKYLVFLDRLDILMLNIIFFKNIVWIYLQAKSIIKNNLGY